MSVLPHLYFLRYMLLFFLVCLLSACSREQPTPKVDSFTYTQPASDTTRAVAHREPAPIIFSDITTQAGIDFQSETGAFGEKLDPETFGGGCVLFDFDGDEALDLLLINGTYWTGHEKKGPMPTSKLYRNLRDGTFEDVTEQAMLDFSFYGMGGAAGDYDGDGDLDLYLTAVGDNLLLQNEVGRFVDVTAKAGVAGGHWQSEDGKEHPEWSTGAAWVDIDKNGWPDLFVCNYIRWAPEIDLFSMFGSVKSYGDPLQYDGTTCRLYRNLGNGTFEDITKQAGIYNPEGKSLGVAIADFNDDGYPDLVVANDSQPNFLYRNLGNGMFEEVALASGVAYSETGRARAGMGVDVASLDNDGSLSIAIGNFSREAVGLYRQIWQEFFIDVAGRRQIARPTFPPTTFGLVFFDCDLDGYCDLALANGHLEPEINEVQKDITYAQPSQLFWNDGAGRFHDISDRSGEVFARPVVGRGLAYGDIDGDGDLDLVLTTSNGPAILMRNDSSVGKAIRVRLRGAFPNREALGAVVEVQAGDLVQQAMVRTGSSYLSQSETVLTFGLENRDGAAVSIRWPNGHLETFEHLKADTTYTIDEGKGVVGKIPFQRDRRYAGENHSTQQNRKDLRF